MPLQKANSRNLMTLPDGRYRIEEGLYLVVRGEGKYRSYVFRYKFVGARRDLSLGSPAVKTLSMVKEDVAKCRLPTRLPARAVMIGRRREIASGNGIADAGSGSDVQHLHDFVPGDRTGVKNGGVIDVQY